MTLKAMTLRNVGDGRGEHHGARYNAAGRDPPASIAVAATEGGGARGAGSAVLAAFLAGGTATDIADPSPVRLAPQGGGSDIDSTTLFPVGATTVTFRFQDAAGNVGASQATVKVLMASPAITAGPRAGRCS